MYIGNIIYNMGYTWLKVFKYFYTIFSKKKNNNNRKVHFKHHVFAKLNTDNNKIR